MVNGPFDDLVLSISVRLNIVPLAEEGVSSEDHPEASEQKHEIPDGLRSKAQIPRKQVDNRAKQTE